MKQPGAPGGAIPMLDLRTEVDELWPEISAAVERVVKSGQFIMGPEAAAFEDEVSRYLGVKHAITVNSGTDALIIGMRAAGIGPGDEVVTTPFTFFATVEAIVHVGATPVLVDIEPPGFNIDVARMEEAITDRTRALLPVHLFGDPLSHEAITDIAKRHGLLIVEDCAQAFGAFYRETSPALVEMGPRVGSGADVAAYSFYPTKNLGAYGDAGLIATNDVTIAEAARSLRVHASDPEQRYVHRGVGYNSRLDEIQAAILRIKLPRVDTWNRQRREVAKRYDALISQVTGVLAPPASSGHVYHQYTVRVADGRRDRLRLALAGAGVATSQFYPSPSYAWPPGLLSSEERFRHTEAAANEALSLPMYPGLTREQQEYVVATIANTM